MIWYNDSFILTCIFTEGRLMYILGVEDMEKTDENPAAMLGLFAEETAAGQELRCTL